MAPSTSPTRVAIAALAVTITQRLGRAISVAARVPCWASAVNMRIPATIASVAMSGRGKMNSSDAVRFFFVADDASAQAMSAPTTGVRAKITLLARREASLIHSLLRAAGTVLTSSRRVRSAVRLLVVQGMAGLVVAMVRVPLLVLRFGAEVGGSGGGELGGGAGHVEQAVLE